MCMGRLSSRQHDWSAAVLCWHCLQCSHDVHNEQGYVRKCGCAAPDLLHLTCILCSPSASDSSTRGIVPFAFACRYDKKLKLQDQILRLTSAAEPKIQLILARE